MADQVRVTSIDALEHFRSRLIVFLSKGRRSIDEAADEVRRTRNWLAGEQRMHWEAEVKKRRKRLEQAEAELMSARMSEFVDAPTVQQMQVRKCKRAVEEAEEKLRNVKKWSQNFDSMAEPLIKKLESVRFYLDQELPKGVTYLSHQQRTLESYAETQMPLDGGSAAPTTSDTSDQSDRSDQPAVNP